MGHRRRRKKHYYSVTDRLWFKISASVWMGLAFILLYYLVVILMENPGMAPIVSVPCALMMIMVALKQRQFWWIWIPVALLLVGLMLLTANPVIDFYLETLYWAASYAMTQWLIVADSKARHRSKSRKSSHHHHHHHSEKTVSPRPRDELLEQLFGDAL